MNDDAGVWYNKGSVRVKIPMIVYEMKLKGTEDQYPPPLPPSRVPLLGGGRGGWGWGVGSHTYW